MSRKRKSVKISWSFVFAVALILSTVILVTLFNGSDWTKWLPSFTLPTKTTDEIPVTSDILVHYIDVGQGDATLIQSGTENVLIDGGNAENSQKLVDYLEGIGIRTITKIFVTHPHDNHIGGLSQVIKRFNVNEVLMPDTALPDTDVYKDFLQTVEDKKIKKTFTCEGNTFTVGDGKIEVLSPAKNYEELHNMSLVLKFVYREKSFLFTGDIESSAEHAILDLGTDVKADVLKVANHGSKLSSTKEFIKAVDAEIYVISVGSENRENYPHTKTIRTLTNTGNPVYRTSVDKNIVIATNGDDLKVYTKVDF